MIIRPGATNQSIYFLLDQDHEPLTAGTITSLDATYIRDGAAAVKSDLTALAAVDSAHSDNKAIEVDATNAPGLYRVDFPDAAFAAGVPRVTLIVNSEATFPSVLTVELAPVGDIVDAVWDELVVDHAVAGTMGLVLGQVNPSAIVVTSVVSGTTITVVRGDTVAIAITGLGNLTGNSKIWFTVKAGYDDADTAAKIQVEKTAGLVYLNGAVAVTPTNASLAIDVLATGDITITLKAALTAALRPTAGLLYDVQWLDGSGHIHTLTYGQCNVTGTPDITRAIT